MKFLSALWGKRNPPKITTEPAPKGPLDHEELRWFKSEAERFARPGKLLRRTGLGEPVAYWHGMDLDGAPCISFLDGAQWYTVGLDVGEIGVNVVPTERALQSATPLFAESYVSLPPLDAVVKLSGHDPTEPVSSGYERIWQDNSPMYRSGISAAMGGWNMPWPENDFDDLMDSELLLWTFEEPEPWIEVFRTQSRIHGYQRIT